MAGVATIHHALRDVDSGAGNVGAVVHVGCPADRPTVNTHPDFQSGMFEQSFARLDCAPNRRIRCAGESQSHSVSGRKTNEFFGGFGHAKRICVSKNLIQFTK